MSDSATTVKCPYSQKTLINDPFELLATEDLKQKDFLFKKWSRGLMVNEAQVVFQKSLAPVDLDVSENGCLKFGSLIQLSHSAGVLSFDQDEKVKKADFSECIAATTSGVKNSCKRNTFVLVRADEKDMNQYDSDHLHYGQGFRIWCSDGETGVFGGEGGWLHSEVQSELSASKISKNCEVCIHQKPNAGTIFRCIARDNRQELSMIGQKVLANDAIVIKHNMSGAYLSSGTEYEQENLFGREHEVCCRLDRSTLGHHKMFSELKGMITGDINQKTIHHSHMWQFKTLDCAEKN